jgi:predicted nucleic acid-binding protein
LIRVAFDTNILAYAEGVRRVDSDQLKIDKSRHLIDDLATNAVTVRLAAQTIAELRHVLCKRLRLSGDAANVLVRRWEGIGVVVATDAEILTQAFTLAARHNLQTYDAIILAAAAEAGCDTLYSEDMKHGFVWRGVEVVNPFLGG